MFRLARFSLANRVLVALITIVIAAGGLFTMTQLKQELIPSIELPASTVVTVVPGASPEVMDEQVSLPISKAIENLEHVETVAAESSSNMSMVSISYEYGTDADEFEASLKSALEGVQDQLPDDAEPSVMSGSTSAIPVMFLTASSDTASASELSSNLDDVVVPRLESIEGIGAVAVSGGETERVVITPDQMQLGMLGLTQQDIAAALEANGMTIPAGSITADGEILPVQGGEALTTLDELASIPLASTTQPGTVVALGDVATVERVAEEQSSITRMNGDAALSISITAAGSGDTVAISHAVAEAIDELSDEYGDDLVLTVVFDQAPFIEESIEHLAIEGLLGLVFAIVVILVFLLSARSTIVTAISIPLSVLVTFIGLYLGGYSLNMLTLGALTIAIGRVVDDSIVVIENIKRHLEYGEEKTKAILSAVREVAGAITASTLTTVAVFVPIALVGGMVGELFSPFALTVTIAMLSSLLVALTIVPVLSYWFLKRPKSVEGADPAELRAAVDAQRAAAEEKEHNSWLQRAYKPILRGTQRHPVVTLLSSVLLLVLTVGMVPLMKVDFLGSTGQNMLMVSQEFEPGTDLDEVGEGATKVEDALADIDGVEDVMMTAGSGEGGMAAMLGGGGGSATFIVNTDSGVDQTELQDEVRERLAEITGAGEISLMDAASMGGFGSTVDVVVTAGDDSELADAADLVYDGLQDVDYAAEVATDRAPAQPILQITVDRVAALQQGLTEMQVLGMVAGTVTPQSIGQIQLDGEDYRIFVDTGMTAPTSEDELAALPIPTAAGIQPLSSLATVERQTVPTSISRDAGDLVATVSLTPEEGELGALTTAVQTELDELDLPSGAKAEIGGLAEMQGESFEQLGLAMLVAIAIVFLLLVATFRSLAQPLILLVSIPFAATGALLMLLATGRPLGVSALIGMLMLIGIVVTNAIVLIDLVNQYRRQGQSVKDAVFNGARQRLRPILMTALATIFALLPMALGVTGSSGFISQDLAIVVIGGLISSTALTLILVPVLYALFEGRRDRKRSRRERKAERLHEKAEAAAERAALAASRATSAGPAHGAGPAGSGPAAGTAPAAGAAD
ncbi:efflux RND transporter permease subunit [Agromyces archimandritae]|uniref:Efflux RND transporter permease subunit n=1 Tax=Agromyces archimandritae TaxID=2781962 RepID=A0A975IPU1_9MICO|nr:efflux RND transporter permease subunit [Agromyces archimandritae]QTX05962.1 efflux RND transporter permease subunit [Agromyces archimandritae]